MALLLAALMLIGSWPTINHFVVHPFITPRFEGVIVYVDSMNTGDDVTGGYTVSLGEVNVEQREFSGDRYAQIVIEQPEEGGVWSVNVFARSRWQVRIRVMDGSTRQLLDEESQMKERSGDTGPGELVRAVLTYSRAVP